MISSLGFWFWSPLLSEDSKGCFTLPVLSSMRHIFSGAQGILSKRSYCIIQGKRESIETKSGLNSPWRSHAYLKTRTTFSDSVSNTQTFWLQSNSPPPYRGLAFLCRIDEIIFNSFSVIPGVVTLLLCLLCSPLLPHACHGFWVKCKVFFGAKCYVIPLSMDSTNKNW